jgi:diguanylate cyclase (GGDEF)-like protein
MILGDAIKWKAARGFIHRPAHVFWILLGPVAFLLAVQSGLLHSFDYRLNALSTTLAVYNFATAYQFSRAKGEQPASRWPVVVLLVLLACFQMLWFPLNVAMPINEARWVAASIWFPTVMLLALLLRVAIAFVVLSLAKERSNIERRMEALTDALTGLPNRRALFEAVDAFGEDRDRTGGAISVLIFDLDHFKRTNDRFGHELGDRVLKLFATTARTHLDGSSVVARLGGEEFAAILPGVDRLGAVETGEAVRHAFANSGAFVDGLPVGATVSVGVAWDAGGGGDLNALFRRADAALYAAKRAGRNRVELLDPDTEDLLPELQARVRAAKRKSPGEPSPRPWSKRA